MTGEKAGGSGDIPGVVVRWNLFQNSVIIDKLNTGELTPGPTIFSVGPISLRLACARDLVTRAGILVVLD
jgi:hypothetical protein